MSYVPESVLEALLDEISLGDFQHSRSEAELDQIAIYKPDFNFGLLLSLQDCCLVSWADCHPVAMKWIVWTEWWDCCLTDAFRLVASLTIEDCIDGVPLMHGSPEARQNIWGGLYNPEFHRTLFCPCVNGSVTKEPEIYFVTISKYGGLNLWAGVQERVLLWDGTGDALIPDSTQLLRQLRPLHLVISRIAILVMKAASSEESQSNRKPHPLY